LNGYDSLMMYEFGCGYDAVVYCESLIV